MNQYTQAEVKDSLKSSLTDKVAEYESVKGTLEAKTAEIEAINSSLADKTSENETRCSKFAEEKKINEDLGLATTKLRQHSQDLISLTKLSSFNEKKYRTFYIIFFHGCLSKFWLLFLNSTLKITPKNIFKVIMKIYYLLGLILG